MIVSIHMLCGITSVFGCEVGNYQKHFHMKLLFVEALSHEATICSFYLSKSDSDQTHLVSKHARHWLQLVNMVSYLCLLRLVNVLYYLKFMLT